MVLKKNGINKKKELFKMVEEKDVETVLKTIKDDIESVGVSMPDLVATGELTVDKKEKIDMEFVDKPLVRTVKKSIPLPEIGAKFMLHGHEYKVTYINAGQQRFSCEPCKGVY